MANGITLGGLEIQGSLTTNHMYFTFIRGGLQSIATFVGQDDDVPLASGMDPGRWRASYRDIALHGTVTSTGATAQAARESFRTQAALLIAKMDPATLITIVAYAPNFGITVAQTATLTNCRPMSIDGPDPAELAWYEVWEVTLNLRCIKSPPDWAVA